MSLIVPVILSGGSGSRLWPKSRQFYPKQLHNLYGDATMLQHTLKRVTHLDKPIVICNQEQRFMVADQIHAMGLKAHILLEPVARNTAPAIAVAALSALQQSPQAIIAVFAADHLIEHQAAFKSALDTAIQQAQQHHLVTFGVVPTRPETGYGYIKTAPVAQGQAAAKVLQFVEKPNLATAQGYLEQGGYYWNSGMFVFPAQQLIQELTALHPQLVAHCQAALAQAQVDLDFLRLNEAAFAQCPDISIDYALMEHTPNAWAVPLDAGWSDLGSWDAVWDISPKDAQGNALEGDVLLHNSHNCLVRASSRLVTLVGVNNLAVIETPDGLLVMDKNQAQDIKHIVNRLQAENRSEYRTHREVHRPWGAHDLVDAGDRYQVKRLTVKPGASLSLQMHHHRAEHWVVVAGTALVQKGAQQQILTENQSLFIPIGETHKITNPGKVTLQLIEVRTGGYLGDDDIVRLDEHAHYSC